MSENQQVVVPPPPQVHIPAGRQWSVLYLGFWDPFLPFIGTIVALITGYPARKEIKGSNGYLR